MRRPNWLLLIILAVVLGSAGGYLAALVFRPGLLPLSLRFGSLREPSVVLVLGVDAVYTPDGVAVSAHDNIFSGRSDTMLVVRLDPVGDSVSILAISRDTQVYIPGHGIQKINAANAFGGPDLARKVVEKLLGLPVDHYVVLSLRGLRELVDELGGIRVEIPKPMKYRDATARLTIDLEPGLHVLSGEQVMGFVRFRHDALGDIGRVKRQQIFLRGLLMQSLMPGSWSHLPALIHIAQARSLTDMSESDMLRTVNFLRAVPRANVHLVVLPGRFSGSGDWLVDGREVRLLVDRFVRGSFCPPTRLGVTVSIENDSHVFDLGLRLSRLLIKKGYRIVSMRNASRQPAVLQGITQIIAQRANPDQALMLKSDLSGKGEIVNASLGDIDSMITLKAADDLASLPGL